MSIKIDSREDPGYNNNNIRLQFQAEQKEGLEENGLNITGRKQAQTINAIVEVI